MFLVLNTYLHVDRRTDIENGPLGGKLFLAILLVVILNCNISHRQFAVEHCIHFGVLNNKANHCAQKYKLTP